MGPRRSCTSRRSNGRCRPPARCSIRVRASTVSQTDTHIRRPSPWVWRLFAGLRRPRWRTLGVDFAGVVEEVGPGVAEFALGDEVFGLVRLFGAHADYVRLPETRLDRAESPRT